MKAPTSKQRSVKQERRIAKDLGGRVTPASGARWGARRDVKSDAWLIEAKTTGQSSYRIEDKDLEFLLRQAYRIGRTPAYVIEFQGQGELVVLPAETVERQAPNVLDVAGRSGITLRVEHLQQVPLRAHAAGRDYAVMSYDEFLLLDESFVP